MRPILLLTLFFTFAVSALPVQAGAMAPSPLPVPAGTYTLDKAHASLIFRVSHLGFSNFTAQFSNFDAQLTFDPENMADAQLTATIDATSLNTDFPWPEKVDFDAQLQNEKWLHTEKYPVITYRSTDIEITGPNTLIVHGELTLRGVTQPVAMQVTYNGGYAGHPLEPQARIGFSAHGTLQRSAFGIDYGVPAPGSNFGVGDTVEFIIEAEFHGPALKDDQQSKAEG